MDDLFVQSQILSILPITYCKERNLNIVKLKKK